MIDTPRRAGVGILVSLLMHAMLLFALRDRLPVRDTSVKPARSAIAVFLPSLKPPAPAAQPVPEENEESRRNDISLRTPRKPQALHEQAAPQTAQSPTAPQQPPPANAAPRPAIDPEAIRAQLPGILKELDREKRQQPVGQLMDKPLYDRDEESRLGHRIANAARPDCMKDGRAGLLTPLLWLADKKGSGCKW